MCSARYLASVLILSITAHLSSLQAQWVRCDGPGGGSALTFGVIGPYTFAGMSGGGLFRSTNSGQSWSAVPLSATTSDVTGIALQGAKILVARDSLYVSADSGTSWQTAALPALAGPIASIGNYLILASSDGVYRTSDLGKTWELTGGSFQTCLLVKGSEVLGGDWSFGLARSRDSGATWTRIDTGGVLKKASIASLGYAGNDIFVGGYYDQGLFRSTDEGATWEASNNGIKSSPGAGGASTISSLLQDGNITLASTNTGVYKSIDSGANWTHVADFYAQAMSKSGANTIAGTNVGIQLSKAGDSIWGSGNLGLSGTRVNALTSVGSHIFASFESSGIYRSDDSGRTWNHLNNSATRGTMGFVSIDTTLFAVAGSQVFASRDLGLSWNPLPNPMSWPITTIGSQLFGANNGFFLSSDAGQNWIKRSDGFHWGNLVCLMSRGSDVYAGNSFGDCGTVYRSKDSGSTWSDLRLAVPCTDVYSLSAAGQYVFAGTGPGYNEGGAGIFRRSDLDTSWSPLASGLPDMTSTAVTSIVAYKQNVIFGCDQHGVFHSSNFGATWNSANEGLTTLNISNLLIAPPYVYAGSNAAGLWRRPLSELIGSNLTVAAQITHHSIRSYPNPLTHSTTINIALDESEDVQVSIVNTLGIEVARLFADRLSPGDHKFTWTNAGNFADGTYDCLLRINGQVEKLPLVLTH